jgi:predicted TIM-barrel fold metal-dependent hydrolase
MIEVIDSDTHVDETDATWEFIPPEAEAHKPITRYPSNPDPSRPPSRYWLIDGHRKSRKIRDDSKSLTKVEARELLDIDVRLRHMDELGVGIQVIYPTLMLVEPAEHAEVELELVRSYNRWLAERCAKSNGRLRWVCIPPTRTPDAVAKELQFAKDNGACGVLKKGDLDRGQGPTHD